jgi:DNA-binding transcriptional regulator YiaG
MANKPLYVLAQRAIDAHYPIDRLARDSGNSPIFGRIMAGEMAGSRAEARIIALLDEAEAHGLQPDAFTLPVVARDVWAEQVEAQQARAEAFHDEIAERRIEDAARRENMRLRAIKDAEDRLVFGQELAALRASSGLTQWEMAKFVDVPPDVLSRLERGKPVGMGHHAAIRDGYALAVKLAGPATVVRPQPGPVAKGSKS